MTQQLTPTGPSEGNAGEEVDPDMPMRLWTALDRIERSEVLPREYDWYL